MVWRSGVDFIGIPFKPFGRDWDGVDCWGLVYLWHKAMRNVELPAYLYGPNSEYASVAMEQETRPDDGALWHAVSKQDRQTGDVAVFILFGRPAHVGLVLSETRMLHIEKGIDSVIEPLFGNRWGNRLYGIFRYAK